MPPRCQQPGISPSPPCSGGAGRNAAATSRPWCRSCWPMRCVTPCQDQVRPGRPGLSSSAWPSRGRACCARSPTPAGSLRCSVSRCPGRNWPRAAPGRRFQRQLVQPRARRPGQSRVGHLLDSALASLPGLRRATLNPAARRGTHHPLAAVLSPPLRRQLLRQPHRQRPTPVPTLASSKRPGSPSPWRQQPDLYRTRNPTSTHCGARIHDRGGDLLSSCSGVRLSSGDLVLVCEPAEDLLPADPVLGQVDLQRPGVSSSRRELVGCQKSAWAVSCSDARGAAAGHDDRPCPFVCCI